MIETIRNSFVEWKISIIGLVLILLNFNCYSQTNLIPNPSFEYYDTCPVNYNGVDQICKATPWFQPAFPNLEWCGGSTDFYHLCASSVPTNYNGYQWPRSGLGYAHAGVYVVNQNNGREYIEVMLNSTLNSTKKYCTSFYISKTSSLYTSSDCIGGHFSEDTVFQFGSYDRINLPMHIKSDSIVYDTLNWFQIKGTYLAQGGEKYITIGCFLPTDEVNYICPTPNPMSCGYSAYYFDDFGVYLLPEIEAGSGGTICEFGDSVQLQASCEGCWDALKYRWWPSVGLSDSTVLNPIATPEVTTTYYFGLMDTTETVPCIVDLVDSVTVTVCDGIEPPVFNFTIQPNPGNAQIELVFTHVAEDTKLYIYDMRGRLVSEQIVPKDSKTYSLDLINFANAQYILKLQNSSGTIRKKLMKM
jgi:hypothetical protein